MMIKPHEVEFPSITCIIYPMEVDASHCYNLAFYKILT